MKKLLSNILNYIPINIRLEIKIIFKGGYYTLPPCSHLHLPMQHCFHRRLPRPLHGWPITAQQQAITDKFICNRLGHGLHHQRLLHPDPVGKLLHEPSCWVSALKHLLSLRLKEWKFPEAFFNTITIYSFIISRINLSKRILFACNSHSIPRHVKRLIWKTWVYLRLLTSKKVWIVKKRKKIQFASVIISWVRFSITNYTSGDDPYMRWSPLTDEV